MIMIPPISITSSMLVSSTIVESAAIANVYATGTITVSGSVTLAQTFVVGEQTFTFVAARAGTGQVTRDTSSTTNQATAIRTAINTDIPDIVAATGSTNVTTLTAVPLGTDGNNIVLTESVTNMTVSGSGYLSGGVDQVIGYDEWAVGTTYDLGDMVMVSTEHRIYESLSAGNVGHTPSSNPTYWLDSGATNRWKMFDNSIGTQSTRTESIVIEVTPGYSINTLALLNCNATSINVLYNDPTAGDVYDSDLTVLSSAATNYLMTDIPSGYPSATFTITIINSGDLATLGEFICGTYHDIGTTRYGIEIGIIDYSIKEADDWGNYTVTERTYSPKATFPIGILMTELDDVIELLSLYRAWPCIWIGSTIYGILTIYGFIKSWDITAGFDCAELSLEIEGLS
jgi:hypothetical protein